MEVSTKELRIQPGRIIDQVVHGEEVTVTFRGKPLAKIVPIGNRVDLDVGSDSGIFAMWGDVRDHRPVEEVVREYRKGREF